MCRIGNVTYRKSIIGNVTDPSKIPLSNSLNVYDLRNSRRLPACTATRISSWKECCLLLSIYYDIKNKGD